MPTMTRILALAILITFFALPSSADAAGYIKFDGIDGESKDANHDKWIDVLSWSWGETQSGQSSRGGSARAPRDGSMGDLVVVKEMDKASPKLQEACANGKFFDEVEIHFATTNNRNSRRTEYMTYKLENVMITSCSTGGSGGEDKLTENISLNFQKIEWTYDKQGRDGANKGKAETEWKVEKGEK